METALENLSKKDHLEVVLTRGRDLSERDEKIVDLSRERDRLAQERDYQRSKVEMLKRMQFGQKREHFEGDPDQISLPFEEDVQSCPRTTGRGQTKDRIRTQTS